MGYNLGTATDETEAERSLVAAKENIILDRGRLREIMVEAAKRVPLEAEYKTSVQIDEMVKDIWNYILTGEKKG